MSSFAGCYSRGSRGVRGLSRGYRAGSRFVRGVYASGMAAVENGHVVLLSHGVDGVEERQEVLLGIYILLTMSRQKDVAAFFQTEAAEDVGSFDFGKIIMEHFGHGASRQHRCAAVPHPMR